MKTYSINVPASGSRTLTVKADFIRVLSADAVFLLTARDAAGRIVSDRLELRTGDYMRPRKSFDEVRVANPTAAAITVKVSMGEGELVSAGLVSHKAPGSIITTDDQSIANDDDYDVAARDAREELILQAPSTNSSDLVVRDTAATTSAGTRLKPGATLILTCAGAVRIRNNSGAAQDLYINELVRA